MTNLEILGLSWTHLSPAEIESQIEHSVDRPLSVVNQIDRITESVWLAVMYHFGVATYSGEKLLEQANLGVDRAVRYFDDSWWREVATPEGFTEALRNEPAAIQKACEQPAVSELFRAETESTLRNSMDREVGRELWFAEIFGISLLNIGLTGRWEDLDKVASWFDRVTLTPEFTGNKVPSEYLLALLYMGCSLNPQPVPGIGDLAQTILDGKSKRAEHFLRAVMAIQNSDQQLFDQAISESLKLFLSKPVPGSLERLAAIDVSSLILLAEHRGQSRPSLTAKQKAVVIGREIFAENPNSEGA